MPKHSHRVVFNISLDIKVTIKTNIELMLTAAELLNRMHKPSLIIQDTH